MTGVLDGFDGSVRSIRTVTGDVAALGRILQDRRQIQPLELERTREREVRRPQIGHQRAANEPGLGRQIQVQQQAIERPVRVHDELRVQLVTGQRRDETPDFRQRYRAVRRQLDDRRPQVAFDDPADIQRALARLDRHAIEIQVVVPHRDRTGQLLDGQVRIRSRGS